MLKFFLMLATAGQLFFAPTPSQESGCPAPTNISASKSGGNISFTWSDCKESCSQYLVKYLRLADGYESPVYSVVNPAFSFYNLPGGDYKFFFATDCNGGSAGFIIVEEAIMN